MHLFLSFVSEFAKALMIYRITLLQNQDLASGISLFTDALQCQRVNPLQHLRIHIKILRQVRTRMIRIHHDSGTFRPSSFHLHRQFTVGECLSQQYLCHIPLHIVSVVMRQYHSGCLPDRAHLFLQYGMRLEANHHHRFFERQASDKVPVGTQSFLVQGYNHPLRRTNPFLHVAERIRIGTHPGKQRHPLFQFLIKRMRLRQCL